MKPVDILRHSYFTFLRNSWSVDNSIILANYIIKRVTSNRGALYKWQSDFLKQWLKPPWEQLEIDWKDVVISLSSSKYSYEQFVISQEFFKDRLEAYPPGTTDYRASGKTTALALFLVLDPSLPEWTSKPYHQWWFFDHYPGMDSTRYLGRMALDFRNIIGSIPNKGIE